MPLRQVDTVRALTDSTLGVSAVTSPFWLRLLEEGAALYVTIIGAILVTLRLALAIREWKQGQQSKEKD